MLASAGVQADEGAVVNGASLYPEGPTFVGGVFYYAEMGADRVMRFDGKANTVAWTRKGCGPTSVAEGPGRTLIVLCHIEPGIAWITPDGATLEVTDVDASGIAFTNPNASIADGNGGVWFSSSGGFSPSAAATGAVLYREKSGLIHRRAEGIHYANGIALSRDGRQLYVSEHLSRNVLLFDIAPDGALVNRRIFVALDDLVGPDPKREWDVGPDGLLVDKAGDLFVAEYGAGRILAITPEGKLAATIPVPEPYVTAAAFGVNERRLFVSAPASRYSSVAGKVLAVVNPLYRDD